MDDRNRHRITISSNSNSDSSNRTSYSSNSSPSKCIDHTWPSSNAFKCISIAIRATITMKMADEIVVTAKAVAVAVKTIWVPVPSTTYCRLCTRPTIDSQRKCVITITIITKVWSRCRQEPRLRRWQQPRRRTCHRWWQRHDVAASTKMEKSNCTKWLMHTTIDSQQTAANDVWTVWIGREHMKPIFVGVIMVVSVQWLLKNIQKYRKRIVIPTTMSIALKTIRNKWISVNRRHRHRPAPARLNRWQMERRKCKRIIIAVDRTIRIVATVRALQLMAFRMGPRQSIRHSHRWVTRNHFSFMYK